MADIVLLLFTTAVVNNAVLLQPLGVSTLLSRSTGFSTACGMAALTAAVLPLSTLLLWPLQHFLLQPLQLLYLRPLIFLLVAAMVSSFSAVALQRHTRLLPVANLELLTIACVNSLVLGTLLQPPVAASLWIAFWHSVGTATGFTFALLALTGLREKTVETEVPAAFQGAGIALITAALMSLAFMGFAGVGT